MLFGSSRSQIFFEVSVSKNFALITGKHRFWSLFRIELDAWIIESYCNSLICFFVLISEIIPKTIWNCIIALIPLLENASRMQRTQTLSLHALSTRKNWVGYIDWMNGKKSKALVRRCYVKKMLLKISPEACNFIKKGLWHRCFLVNFANFLSTHFL